MQLSRWMVALLAVALAAVGASFSSVLGATSIRITGGGRIVPVSESPRTLAAGQGSTIAIEPGPHPMPPVAGSSPLVVITTSDSRSDPDDLDFQHHLHLGYVGSPLNPPASLNFVVGILDSGSVVDLVASPYDAVLGLTGPYLTPNTIPIGGTGGTVDALISQPIGYFATSLGAVRPDGYIDSLKTVPGHANTSVVVAPEISCGDGEGVSAIVGTPFLSFFTTVIRVDEQRAVTIDNEAYKSPDVQILANDAPTIPTYPRSVPISFGGLVPVTTASYYPDFYDLETPITPTLLSLSPLSLPFGGAFFTTIKVREGVPGPENPTESMRVLFDTGAQTSIMSPAIAGALSLPIEPDFTVAVCGVGGIQEDVPLYFIDYVKIDAWGGAMEFSNVPFVILNLESPEGGPLDGVLGMNFFWNRNIVFEPSVSTSGFVHVSDPVSFSYGDFDFDGRVNMDDFELFAPCMTGPGEPFAGPECPFMDADEDGDLDQTDFGFFQMCMGSPADPSCGP